MCHLSNTNHSTNAIWLYGCSKVASLCSSYETNGVSCRMGKLCASSQYDWAVLQCQLVVKSCWASNIANNSISSSCLLCSLLCVWLLEEVASSPSSCVISRGRPCSDAPRSSVWTTSEGCGKGPEEILRETCEPQSRKLDGKRVWDNGINVYYRKLLSICPVSSVGRA